MFSFLKNKFGSQTTNRIYMDYAGATPVSVEARNAFLEALSYFGNPSGIHKEGVEAGRYLDKARTLSARILNAHAYEIYFTSTGTESCNLAILGTYYAYAKNPKFSKTPHVIVSLIEHPAVLEPIKQLEKDGKIHVTYLPVYDDGVVLVHDVKDALREETILVSVMYANNEIGTLQPIKEIGRTIETWKQSHGRTHTAYPYFHTDACQVSNYCNLDVVRLRAHLMTLNSSKCYGPKGVALLYKREGIYLTPYTYGGGQERELRSGTEDVAGAFAFATALVESQSMKESEVKRLLTLQDYAHTSLLEAIPDVVFYGAQNDMQKIKTKDGAVRHDELVRLPNNVNIRIPGISSEEMILRLDAEGVAVSHKSACASAESNGSYVIESLGKSEQEALENIRITFGRQTTQKEIDHLVQALTRIAEKYRVL